MGRPHPAWEPPASFPPGPPWQARLPSGSGVAPGYLGAGAFTGPFVRKASMLAL
jgi:hypothetical protein